jgi:hypothetical protein
MKVIVVSKIKAILIDLITTSIEEVSTEDYDFLVSYFEDSLNLLRSEGHEPKEIIIIIR